MLRDELFLMIFEAYLENNELRHDLNEGKAICRELPKKAIATMFDLADAVLAEKYRRAGNDDDPLAA